MLRYRKMLRYRHIQRGDVRRIAAVITEPRNHAHFYAHLVFEKTKKSGEHEIRTRNPLRGTSFPMKPLAIRLLS